MTAVPQPLDRPTAVQAPAPGRAVVVAAGPAWQAFQLLHWAFVVLPLTVGADKFFDVHVSDPKRALVIGDIDKTFAFWKTLFESGVFTNAVIPPAVPPNASEWTAPKTFTMKLEPGCMAETSNWDWQRGQDRVFIDESFRDSGAGTRTSATNCVGGSTST